MKKANLYDGVYVPGMEAPYDFFFRDSTTS
jgi:hypothetical protein